jgi:hypothetical protein
MSGFLAPERKTMLISGCVSFTEQIKSKCICKPYGLSGNNDMDIPVIKQLQLKTMPPH